MTTIAYKDGVVAYDSRLCSGPHILSDSYEKRVSHEGVEFFVAGEFEHREILFAHFVSKAIGVKAPHPAKIRAMAWDGENLWQCGYDDSNDFFAYRMDYGHDALGSGDLFAIGAMDAGLTAEEAVKIAMLRDTHTGGPVRTFTLQPEEASQ